MNCIRYSDTVYADKSRENLDPSGKELWLPPVSLHWSSWFDLVSADGVSTGYALSSLEARGALFIGPGVKVYEGMVIGEHTREADLDINPCKSKVSKLINGPYSVSN